MITPVGKQSIGSALKSPLSLVLLAYGAVALFNQWRDWFSLPLAPHLLWLVALYRQSIEVVLTIPTKLAGITIPWFWQDIAVIYLAVGRVASRTYALLYSDSQHFGVKYKPLNRGLLRWLATLTIKSNRRLPSKLGWLATFPAGMAATLVWPWVLPIIIRNPTVTKEDYWYEPIAGGTPHPTNYRQRELPPIGGEHDPKFSVAHSGDFPRHNANFVLVTYALVQVVLAAVMILVNSLAT